MGICKNALFIGFLFAVLASGTRGNQAQDQSQLPADYVPSGAVIYKQYCAGCHGIDAKGHGPARSAFRIPPPDLTTLAKRHSGKFPSAYVTGILRFGPGVFAHGSSKMPTWGPLFDYYYNEDSAKRRIQNLSDFLAALQEK